jgi:hypothetical protein
MFRIGSRAHRVHSSRNAAKFSTSSISSTHILCFPFQFFQLNLSSCIFILHWSRVPRFSRSTSAPFRRIFFQMKFTRPCRHSRISATSCLRATDIVPLFAMTSTTVPQIKKYIAQQELGFLFFNFVNRSVFFFLSTLLLKSFHILS